MKARGVLTSGAFALATAAIAGGVLTDARETRLEALLSEIVRAEERIPYEGTRLFKGTDTVALRVWSRDGRQRVEFLGVRDAAARRPVPHGPGRSRGPRVPYFGGIPIFLRPGHDQWKRKIKDGELTVRNYEVVFAGRETVAGRAADLLELRPRQPGRAGYRIAADAENRFPLSFAVLSGGSRVFEAAFEEIRYNPEFAPRTFDERPRPPGWLAVERTELPPERLSAGAGTAIWTPSRLPRGFELRGAEIVHVRPSVPEAVRQAARTFFPVPKVDVRVAHLNYTDGMSVLSVVQCPAGSELWKFVQRFIPGMGARRENGKVVAQKVSDPRGSAYFLELEDTVVIVAGNIPAPEIEEMIRTFERR
jgi:sigma-E factor negative regulatory protein RseB